MAPRTTPTASPKAAISHAAGFEFQLKNGPLDFYAVTDHGIYLGNMEAWVDPEYELADIEAVRRTAEIAASDSRVGVS